MRLVDRVFQSALVFLILCIPCSPALAAPPVFPLADFNTSETPVGSGAREYTALGTQTLMVADDGVHGTELWLSDGDPFSATVSLVRDIWPGPTSSDPSLLVPMGGKVYFVATTADAGTELWVTDGTEAGTRLVTEVETAPDPDGPLGSSIENLTATAGALFYSRRVGNGARELWRYAVGAAPYRVIDAATKAEVVDVPMIAHDGGVAFTGTTPSTGVELWISDGTELGTTIVEEVSGAGGLVPGADGSDAVALASDGAGRLFFAASTPTHGNELWSYEAGAVTRWTDANAGTADSNPRDAVVFKGELCFVIDGAAGPQLRMTSVSTTVLVANLEASWLTVLEAEPGSVFDVDYLVFLVGDQLYATEGTSSSTANITPTGASIAPWIAAREGYAHFFLLQAGGAWGDLWRASGHPDDTGLVRACHLADCEPTIWNGVRNAGPGGEEIYFTLIGQGLISEEPHRIGQGLDLVADIGRREGDSNPTEFASYGSHVFFPASLDDEGRELASWDGVGSAELVEDLWLGPLGSSPREFFSVAGGVYYRSTVSASQMRHIVDPGSGSQAVAPDAGWLSVAQPFAATNTDVFAKVMGAGGWGVWTVASSGSSLIAQGFEQLGDRSAQAMLGGSLYFLANDADHGTELYETDGVTAQRVKDLFPGAGSGADTDTMVATGDRVFFAGRDADANPGLVVSDGTGVGTSVVFGGEVEVLGTFGANGVFRYCSPTQGCQLWGSAGLAVTTFALTDIEPVIGSAIPEGAEVVEVGGVLYFTAWSSDAGLELWKLDGVDQPRRVADLEPGPVGSDPHGLLALPNGDLLFVAYTSTRGYELYRIDAMTERPRLVRDIWSGIESSMPTHLTVHGDFVVFAADSGPEGREPWAYDWVRDTMIFADGFESGDTTRW